MKVPAQPSHHEANPPREMWIGESQPDFWLDVSVSGRLSTRNFCEPRVACICAIEKSLRKHRSVSKFCGQAWYHIVEFSLKTSV